MIADVVERLAQCETTAGVQSVFAREVARHGYTASACRSFREADSNANPRIFFRNWPEDWAKLSDDRNFASHSPVQAEARKRLMPFAWDDVVRGRALSGPEQAAMDAVRARGWSNGFVVPVHGPDGYFATVGMASPEKDLDLRPSRRLELHMIALAAHERCRNLVASHSGASARELLSARELECFRWVAAGKTNWEIGTILGVRASTVKFHIDRARMKLGTRTRAQAVAKLMMTDLF